MTSLCPRTTRESWEVHDEAPFLSVRGDGGGCGALDVGSASAVGGLRPKQLRGSHRAGRADDSAVRVLDRADATGACGYRHPISRAFDRLDLSRPGERYSVRATDPSGA